MSVRPSHALLVAVATLGAIALPPAVPAIAGPPPLPPTASAVVGDLPEATGTPPEGEVTEPAAPHSDPRPFDSPEVDGADLDGSDVPDADELDEDAAAADEDAAAADEDAAAADALESAGAVAPDAGETPVSSLPVEPDFTFSMIGFQLPPDAVAQGVAVRTRAPGDVWSDWTDLDVEEPGVDGPDLDSSESQADRLLTTEPLWVEEADAFQVSVDGELADLEAMLIDTDGLNEGRVRGVLRRLTPRVAAPAAEAAPARPTIISRSEWGADESIRRGSPSYASEVTFAVAHHTAGTNSYTRSQSASIVRGVYEWHVNGNGWNDIGYNILVDKYGQVFEGRYGGLDRGVVGAHAGGFNSGSFGVAVLGNYETADLPSAAVDAFNRVVAWKYGVHDIDADPDRWINVHGRTIRPLSGHRDVGSTACPGRYFTAKMPGMRSSIASIVAASTRTASVPASAVPVPGDWNGDGQDQPGWFHDGTFYLAAGAHGSTVAFRYGRAGDQPVSGDWNGNGRDGVGVFRDGYWYVRNELSRGASWRHFRYGRAGDQPVAGDWNRTGRDGVGVFRDGYWYVRNELSAGASWRHFRYGRAGDHAVTGDWQRLGRDGVGVVRGNYWYVRSHLKAGASHFHYPFGRVTDTPIMGDWNGNGRDTSGIIRIDHWRFSNRMPAAKPDRTLSYSPSDDAVR